MSLRNISTIFKIVRPLASSGNCQHATIACKSSLASEALQQNAASPSIITAVPAPHLSAKVIFDNNQTADFKYIWLRDNCRCEKCIDKNTRQKLIDTPSIDVNVRPNSLTINDAGQLEVKWMDGGADHFSKFDSSWLYKYGQSFIHNNFGTDSVDIENASTKPSLLLWNRTKIWGNLPELSYNEFMGSEEGIRLWLEKVYKYGVAILRGVPTELNHITEVAKRFAYVKETQYGQIFDVVNKPQKDAHLAYSGLFLQHHTDMNYREKSPGMQMLHCLKANDPRKSSSDPGGKSFFVDGFRVAKWMEDNEPSAFHILTSTPVRFSIVNDGMKYSATWPIICLDANGDVCEIHYNNRTMMPLQTPVHVVTPFYHAYKMFSEKLREASNAFEFNMVPGDLVAFNNRRVLHGRTAYDPTVTDRHLQGCYVDIDEAFSKYHQLQTKLTM